MSRVINVTLGSDDDSRQYFVDKPSGCATPPKKKANLSHDGDILLKVRGNETR